ncbi:hypothetical protein [uncultured Desulfosarcina sp.]|nr:hypothetical protein [uncultured Desulfosarcina sp.]
MQRDPVIQRKHISAMQSTEGLQPHQPYDSFGTQFKLMCFSMQSTFVRDL